MEEVSVESEGYAGDIYHVVHDMIAKIPSSLALDLPSNLRKLPQSVKVGSFFSGCEIFYPVLICVLEALNECYEMSMSASLAFIAEIDGWKRAFAESQHQPLQSFGAWLTRIPGLPGYAHTPRQADKKLRDQSWVSIS